MIIAAVYDRAIEGFGPLMTFKTRGEAIRSFKEAAKGDTNVAKHPTDYELWQLGTYNDNAGLIDGDVNNKERIARAEDLIGE